MRLQDPLGVIAPTLDSKVLKVLARADDWFAHRTVTQMTHASRRGVYNVLQRLAEEGIIEVLDKGSQQLVRLNRDHLAAPAIIELADLSTKFIERLRQDIAKWAIQPAYAAMFGSGARGEMRTGSDIDLFFLWPEHEVEDWDLQIYELVARASSWTGNDVRPMTWHFDEALGAAATESVIRAIRDEGITLAGDRYEFQKLVS